MTTRRDKNGRFVKGNKASPGRPARDIERDYLDAILGVVTLKDWKQVIKVALAQALDGDAKARSWLGDYLVGKPPQILDIRGSDAITLQRLLEETTARGVNASDLFNAMLAEVANMPPVVPDDSE